MIVAVLIAIALYFTLFWGLDAFHVLTSANFGLEDVWRSQYVFAVGRIFSLSPIGLYELAAFFGALKLAAAVAFALHIVSRFAGPVDATANAEVLEAGLILVVLISIVSVGPAVWSHNADLVRENTIHLVLAAVATGLCIVERSRAPAPMVLAEVAAPPAVRLTRPAIRYLFGR
jgi:hypothetical protein